MRLTSFHSSMISNLNSRHSSGSCRMSLKMIRICSFHFPAKDGGISKLNPVRGMSLKTSSDWMGEFHGNGLVGQKENFPLTPAGIGQLLYLKNCETGYHGSTWLSNSKHMSATRRFISPLCHCPRSNLVLEMTTTIGSVISFKYFTFPERTVIWNGRKFSVVRGI